MNSQVAVQESLAPGTPVKSSTDLPQEPQTAEVSGAVDRTHGQAEEAYNALGEIFQLLLRSHAERAGDQAEKAGPQQKGNHISSEAMCQLPQAAHLAEEVDKPACDPVKVKQDLLANIEEAVEDVKQATLSQKQMGSDEAERVAVNQAKVQEEHMARLEAEKAEAEARSAEARALREKERADYLAHVAVQVEEAKQKEQA